MQALFCFKRVQHDAELQSPKRYTIISNLPRKNIISTPYLLIQRAPDGIQYHNYQGFWYAKSTLEGVLKAQDLNPSEFSLSRSDVVLCSCPKTGSTWLKALAYSIVTRSHCSQQNPLFTSFPHDLIPFIEMEFALKHTPRHPDLPLLSTHMPFAALPKSIFDSGCKFVYVCGDPKDVFISYWKFVQTLIPFKRAFSLKGALDRFCRGISAYGPYWDHILGYWKASLEHPGRILFLKYEDMMNEPEFHVRKLAEFMDCPFSSDEEMKGVPSKIVKICSFESLSNMEVNKTGAYQATPMGYKINHSHFFRKAKVEDWKNYLTAEMAEKLDVITREKLGGYGLTL